MHMCTHAHTYTCISSLLSGNSPASLCLFPSPLPLFYRSPNPLPILHTKKNHLPGVCAGLVPRYVWTGPSHPEFLPTVPSIDPSQSRSLRCILTTTPRLQLYFAYPFSAHQPPRCFKLTWELLFISTSPWELCCPCNIGSTSLGDLQALLLGLGLQQMPQRCWLLVGKGGGGCTVSFSPSNLVFSLVPHPWLMTVTQEPESGSLMDFLSRPHRD